MSDPASLRQPQPAPPAPVMPPASGSAAARAGMPVTVWPAIPPPGLCPAGPDQVPCPRRYSEKAAAAVIGALSQPSDLVAVPGPGDAVFTAAAVAAARQVTGPAGACCPRRDRDAAPARGPDPGPCSLTALCTAGAGRAALAVVTACPGCGPPSVGDACGDGAGTCPRLYVACRRLLRPGGLLAVVTSAVRDPGHAGQVIAAARAAGLVYAQHVIAVHAPIDGDRLACPWPEPGSGDDAVTATGQPHLPVHTDLLLFQPGGNLND